MRGLKDFLSTTRQRLDRKKGGHDTGTRILAPNEGNIGSSWTRRTVPRRSSEEGFTTSAPPKVLAQNSAYSISSSNGICETSSKEQFKNTTAPKEQMEAFHSVPKLPLSKKKDFLRACGDGDKKSVGKLLSKRIDGMMADDYLQCMRSSVSCDAASEKHRRFIVNGLVKHSKSMPFFESLAQDMEDLWLYVDSGTINTLCGDMTDSTKLYLMGIGVKNPGNAPLIKALLNSGADPNVYGKGEPVFLTAVRSRNLEVIKVFLDHRAASENDPATSFDRVLDINVTDRNQQTALHKAITELDPETPVVKLLLDQGADASTTDADGQTALHKAAQRNQTISIELLLDHGTDIAAPDTQGRTALHLAAERNHVASAKLLLARGAPTVPKTKKDKTPIQLAGDNGHRETFNVLREHVGLSAVEGKAYDPSLSNPSHEIQLLSDDGRQQRTRDERRSVHEFGGVWPDHAIQDQQTREWSALTPNDARYWD